MSDPMIVIHVTAIDGDGKSSCDHLIIKPDPKGFVGNRVSRSFRDLIADMVRKAVKSA